MNKPITHSLPFLLILTILLLSCSAPKKLEYREFRNFSVQKIGFSTSSVKMDMIYYNPNGFGLQLKRTELDVFVNALKELAGS